MASPEWHWEQGVKYAVEGIKAALILNGAAAIALMTFANTHGITPHLRIAVMLFAFGALLSVGAFVGSYFTELYYGNAELQGADKKRVWSQGKLSHTITLSILLASMILFVIGAAFAAFAF